MPRRQTAAARTGRNRHPRHPRETVRAFFVLASASAAGFSIRTAGTGKLEIVGPVGVPTDVCEPTIAAVRAHGGEILRLLRWLDDERRQGRIWSPRPGPGTPQ
jgi:hypothetical protein